MLKLTLFKVSILLISLLSLKDNYVVKKPEFEVKGTSTLHDWSIKSQKATGSAEIKTRGNAINEISSLRISIPSESLKSGRRAMDNNTYKALNTKEHPDIIYELVQIRQITQRGNQSEISSSGNLTIAGTTRRVNLTATGTVQGNYIFFQGAHNLKMSDFNIDPPSFMGGTIRTGDEVAINFNVKLKSN